MLERWPSTKIVIVQLIKQEIHYNIYIYKHSFFCNKYIPTHAHSLTYTGNKRLIIVALNLRVEVVQ